MPAPMTSQHGIKSLFPSKATNAYGLSDFCEPANHRPPSSCLIPSWFSRQNPIKAGNLNCRAWVSTDDDTNYFSCKKLAETWSITLGWCFRINPTVKSNCSNMQNYTRYYVKACESSIYLMRVRTCRYVVLRVLTEKQQLLVIESCHRPNHKLPPTIRAKTNSLYT
jgi:hypothetical protein